VAGDGAFVQRAAVLRSSVERPRSSPCDGCTRPSGAVRASPQTTDRLVAVGLRTGNSRLDNNRGCRRRHQLACAGAPVSPADGHASQQWLLYSFHRKQRAQRSDRHRFHPCVSAVAWAGSLAFVAYLLASFLASPAPVASKTVRKGVALRALRALRWMATRLNSPSIAGHSIVDRLAPGVQIETLSACRRTNPAYKPDSSSSKAVELTANWSIYPQYVDLKVKVGTSYSASYMSQTRDQKRFTISEVAADWHELMIYCSALCGHPLPASANSWTRSCRVRSRLGRSERLAMNSSTIEKLSLQEHISE